MRKSSTQARFINSVESLRSASDAIGVIEKDMRVFSVTRGQWSMIDAIMHCINSINDPVELSLWTWTIAEYEYDCIKQLIRSNDIKSAVLIVDLAAKNKSNNIKINRSNTILNEWRDFFGENSVKIVSNHAKIATIRSNKYKLLLRGSMNLNFNPRFEQFDLSEGCSGFDLVKKIEAGIPVLTRSPTRGECHTASGVTDLYDIATLDLFSGVRPFKL